MYWWELELKDGSVIPVKPDRVAWLRSKRTNKEIIQTKTRDVNPFDIVDFRMTSRPYQDNKLIAAAAQAFNEPVITDNGAIRSTWVKRQVTHREYTKHYSGISAYHRLYETDGLITVAFCLPWHAVDPAKVDYCTEDEIKTIAK